MSIEKKSLISTLKTTKKANIASSTPSVEVTHKMTKLVAKRGIVKAHKMQKTVAKRAFSKVAAKVTAKVVRA